jgi:ubiquinone/menaquinone biosynthesis C-methylase UbiE
VITMDTVAATLDAYERWAPRYPPVAHNPLMRAEQQAMLRLWPAVAGLTALDLACGTGRYSRVLAEKGAGDVISVDVSPAMLRSVGTHRVRAGMAQLPFPNDTFDVVICGLAIGHAPRIDLWMAEVARILRPGGILLYSDFHPAAAHAGLPRTFKDSDDRVVVVPHHCHEIAAQRRAAADAHLTIDTVAELRVGVEIREAFSNSDEFYRRWHALPIVLVVRSRK